MSKGEVARYSIVSAGVWWAVFTSLPLIRLRNRPAVAGEARGSVLTDGFRQLWHTLRKMQGVSADARVPRRLPDLQRRHPDRHHHGRRVRRQAARPVPEPSGWRRSCMVQFLAFGGALPLGRLAAGSVPGHRPRSLVVWIVTSRSPTSCRPTNAPVHPARCGYRIVLGGSQSLCRSLFSQLIPQGARRVLRPLRDFPGRDHLARPAAFGLAYQPRTATGWRSSRCWCSSSSGWSRSRRCRCGGPSKPPATSRRRCCEGYFPRNTKTVLMKPMSTPAPATM